MVPVEELSCEELERKILEVSWSHTKYFYLGYTETVSSYLQSTGPKSAAWAQRKASFIKEAVYYCWVRSRDLARLSEQGLIDRYGASHTCLNGSHCGEHRPGVVYVVVYTENRAATWGAGAVPGGQDPWGIDLLMGFTGRCLKRIGEFSVLQQPPRAVKEAGDSVEMTCTLALPPGHPRPSSVLVTWHRGHRGDGLTGTGKLSEVHCPSSLLRTG
ncbi:aldo/keto reductase [Platysternon megacephalum]|uniref:Aldo/keto reductase n=1 Tax=Platysternon megacephalum TaxID=55544 RepID=A0A4D9DNZ8_9SAUR|nr:aldo/keto reductase [Platysternon megacephalum]